MTKLGFFVTDVGTSYQFNYLHCLNSVKIRSFFRSIFSYIWKEYVDLFRKSLYSVRIQENKEEKNSVFGHFSRSASVRYIETFKVYIWSVNILFKFFFIYTIKIVITTDATVISFYG